MAALRCGLRGLWRNQVLTARICTRLTAHTVVSFSSESGDSEQRLCKGINYLKEGSDPPLLADSEYPEWLWSILDDKKKPKADEESPVDINNKTLWRRKRKLKIREQNAMRGK